jgi:hypothetical protein
MKNGGHLTANLIARGHVITKALHANMFLVRAAKDITEEISCWSRRVPEPACAR